MPVDRKLVAAIAAEHARKMFLKPLAFTCLRRSGVLAVVEGKEAMRAERVTVVCENVGQYADFVSRVMRGELMPVPDIGAQAVVAILDMLGALRDPGKEEDA